MWSLRDTYKSYNIFEIYHVKYTDICSILNLDTFSFHISVKSHVYHLGTQIFVQSYTWTDFIQYFWEISGYHVKYTDFI